MAVFKNTLYITTPESYVSLDHLALVVRSGNEKRRIPLHHLASVVIIGPSNMSQYAMAACAARGISIAYLTERGRFLARIEGRVSGNVLLRRAHYRRADDKQFRAEVSRSIVAAKVVNQRAFLRRLARDRGAEPEALLGAAAARLTECLRRLRKTGDVDSIRGIEGESAGWYFSALRCGISDPKLGESFRYRLRRPPPDPVNALLSFLYTVLCNDLRSAIEAVGLDPQVGFLHVDRPGRPSLALDMMEEFRAPIIDRLALTVLNRNQLRATDFRALPTGACELEDDARKRLLTEYQNRKAETMTHPLTHESAPLGTMFIVQARIMARVIRGELPQYPPLTFT